MPIATYLLAVIVAGLIVVSLLLLRDSVYSTALILKALKVLGEAVEKVKRSGEEAYRHRCAFH
jgi:hypothetical protein